ncbi:hypothetical protein HQN87_16545 [Paenibacillus tritici]|uniref:Phage protein n=1 Tax=Paenibacillus tritici TaxID=1873425 RepID=A0ABX2DTQ5_9BACL|nr:hypothetical protein [Paenibacillus tritici]NQX46949.1 hypothetical protein [Paenibacillus tritici]
MEKCICCKRDFDEAKVLPIVEKGTDCYYNEEDLSGNYICKHCLKVSEDYGQCDICSEEVVYHESDLEYSGGEQYCSEHISETEMDEEEDWDDYIEKINKD